MFVYPYKSHPTKDSNNPLSAKGATLEYEVFMPSDFDCVKYVHCNSRLRAMSRLSHFHFALHFTYRGGKLMGLSGGRGGGRGCGGGADPAHCFNARIMWRRYVHLSTPMTRLNKTTDISARINDRAFRPRCGRACLSAEPTLSSGQYLTVAMIPRLSHRNCDGEAYLYVPEGMQHESFCKGRGTVCNFAKGVSMERGAFRYETSLATLMGKSFSPNRLMLA